MRKTVREIVKEAYEKILELSPTREEIQAFAELHENIYGVVTYSKSKRGSGYFVDFHDTYKKKFGGRIHIDVGYVNEECSDQRGVMDTTHLMLDKEYSVAFVDFIKEKRKNKPKNIK